MTAHSGVLGGMLATLGQSWRPMLRLLAPFILMFAGLLVLEGVAISRMDQWLPVDSMETAEGYSPIISAVVLWLRLCVIGAALYRALNASCHEESSLLTPKFLGFWCTVSLALAVSLLAIDLSLYFLRYGGMPLAGESVRSILLTALYGRFLVFYLAARFLFGATSAGRGADHGWRDAWSATSTLRSFGVFLELLILKLVIENVFVTALSYVPLISPFWFIPDELVTYRFFVAQGTRIAAESIGVLFYVAFWMALDRRVRPQLEYDQAGN